MVEFIARWFQNVPNIFHFQLHVWEIPIFADVSNGLEPAPRPRYNASPNEIPCDPADGG